jgi:hypothetical protein
MAAPTRNLFLNPTGSVGTTAYTPTLTTIASGSAVEDMIVLALAIDTNPTVTLADASAGAGWELTFVAVDATLAVTLAVLRYRVHTAGTVPNPTINISVSKAVSAHCVRVRPSSGKEIAFLAQTTAQGSSTNPDPPSLTNNTGASQDFYFLDFYGADAITASTAAPTNYGNHQSHTIASAGIGTTIGSADRTLTLANAASENAGGFTKATEQWVATAFAFYERDITMRFNGGMKHAANYFASVSALAITNLQINWGAGTWAYLTQPKTTGKYYYEFKLTAYAGAGIGASIGIGPGTFLVGDILSAGVTFYSNTGIYLNGTLQTTFSGGWAANDVLQLCVDYDNGLVWPGKNNAFNGSPAAGTGGIAYAASGKYVGTAVYTKDDGAGTARTTTTQLTTAAQTYAPPSGFLPAGDPVAGGGTDALTSTNIATTAPAISSSALGTIHVLASTALATTAPAINAGAIGQVHALAAIAMAMSAPAITTSTLTQTHSMSATNVILSAPALSAASIGTLNVLGSSNIAVGPPTITNATATLIVGLTAANLNLSAPALGIASIGQKHALSGQNVVTAVPQIGQQTISGYSVLTTQGLVTSAPALGVAVPGQKHVLSGAPVVTSAPVLGQANMTGSAGLTASNISAGIPVLSQAGIGQKHSLSPSNIATATPVISSAIFGQKHTLTSQSLATGNPPIISLATTGVKHVLVAQTLTLPPPDMSPAGIVPPGSERVFAAVI